MHRIQLVFGALALLVLGGCEVVGTLFEVGMWFGIILVLVIVGAIGFVVSRFRRRD